MVYIPCPICGNRMDCIDTDSRGEWTEEKYFCEDCNKTKIRRIEYDQNGFVTSDEVN